MSDNIKLPPMPKPHTPPVFATAANTPSVKAGYELGGYEKTPPLFDEHQLEAYAREAVRLNAQAVPVGVIERAIEALTYCEALNRNIEHQKLRSLTELHNILSAAPAAPQPAQPLDLSVMELAESVGLIGPASRTDDLHEAIQRFHDLIVVNASIKAARHFADGLAQQPLTDEKDALLRQALNALEGFANITNDSQGVAGYHPNGDTAEWDEFDEVDAASSTIEAIREHLGVKND